MEGSRYVSFDITPPPAGWPLGKYEARLLLNGEEKARVPFSVVDESHAAASSVPAASSASSAQAALGVKLDQISYKRVAEAGFGFSFEMPSDWTWELTPQKDYLISGTSGSAAFEIAIICQIIAKQGPAAASLQAQFEEAQRQLAAVPGSKLQKKGLAKIAGVEAPFFIVKYAAKDSKGIQVDFAHSQLVLETRDYYLWLSYAAPVPVYTAYLPVFQHLVDTFGFSAGGPSQSN